MVCRPSLSPYYHYKLLHHWAREDMSRTHVVLYCITSLSQLYLCVVQ